MWLYKSVGKLKGIWNQGEAKMNKMNIHTIVDLQRYVWLCGFIKLTIQGFGQIYEHGLEALPGKPMTSIKYHRKAKNPYLSMYREICEEKLKSSSYMSKFFCITYDKLMKGSVHEDNLFIVHYALVLMAAEETITWMREKNFFHRWLLPMNVL